MKKVNRFILGTCVILIIRNIKTKKEERVLGSEIKNGKMQISIPQHIYRIICCGDQNMGFASSTPLFFGLSLYERTIIFPPFFACRNPLPYFPSPYI